MSDKEARERHVPSGDGAPGRFSGALPALLKGFCMGSADIVPGVSGGTMALILGIYERLLRAIRSFDGAWLTLLLRLRLREAFGRNDLDRGKAWLLVTAMLGAVFMGGQAYEFTAFYEEGLGYTTNPAASAFYTLTGFHGAHVSIGIIMLMSLWVAANQGKLTGKNSETVEIVGLYWHFVDLVWIFIFTVIYLIPPE